MSFKVPPTQPDVSDAKARVRDNVLRESGIMPAYKLLRRGNVTLTWDGDQLDTITYYDGDTWQLTWSGGQLQSATNGRLLKTFLWDGVTGQPLGVTVTEV